MLPVFICLYEICFFRPSENMHSDVNRNQGRHSSESGNPEEHWIPGQARNDKPRGTHVIAYRFFRGPTLRMLFILIGLGLLGLILLGGKYIDVIREGYLYRDFTMSERVLTQLRVVLHYLTLLIFPHPSRHNLW